MKFFSLSFTFEDYWVEKKRRMQLSFRRTEIVKNNQEAAGLGVAPGPRCAVEVSSRGPCTEAGRLSRVLP